MAVLLLTVTVSLSLRCENECRLQMGLSRRAECWAYKFDNRGPYILKYICYANFSFS